MIKTFTRKLIVRALDLEARLVLKKYHPRIVAVTGSVGKTSTKDAVAAVVQKKFFARKSEKSYNTEFGIPLTILGCGNAWGNMFRWIGNLFEGLLLIIFPHHYPAWLVLEVGADRPGDIESVAQWLAPEIAVITHIGETPVHVEFFASPEEVAQEKSFLARAVKPAGLCIVNADDPVAQKIGTEAKARVQTYGTGPQADLRAESIHIMLSADGRPEGMTYKANWKGTSVPIRIYGAVGKQVALTTLPALLVGLELGINLVESAETLAAYAPPLGRGRILAGIKESVLIDDTYNSSPAAVHAALETMLDLEIPGPGRKIAVLGDMMELGKFTMEAHREAGAHAGEVCDLLLAVGARAKFFAEGAIAHGMKSERVHFFDDAVAAGEWLGGQAQAGDVILVKGSQYMRMERCVELLMAQPADAPRLLVRQEKEWKRR